MNISEASATITVLAALGALQDRRPHPRDRARLAAAAELLAARASKALGVRVPVEPIEEWHR